MTKDFKKKLDNFKRRYMWYETCPGGAVHQPVQETKVRSLGREDPLEGEMATPVFLPGNFQGQRSLTGYSLRRHKQD